MESILQEIGQRLFTRRKRLGMTQEDLAEQAGVSAQTISFAEQGRKAMRADTIIGVCGALEISADYLLFGKITPENASTLEQKMSKLPPEQFRCLEDIVDSFITAVTWGDRKSVV